MRIVLVLLALTTGCSWMASRPVRTYPNGSVDCSTSRGAPGVDTAMAITTGLIALPALAEAPAAGLLFGGIAALYVASASHGYKQAGQCREAIEGLAMQEDSEPEERPHWVAPRQGGVTTRDSVASDEDDSEAQDDEEDTEDDDDVAKTDKAPSVKVNAAVEIDASELEP